MSLETTQRIRPASSSRLEGMADASVDLVVTSPPYPMIGMWDDQFGSRDPAVAEALGRGDCEAAYEGMHRLLDEVWAECCRVAKPGAFVCVNVGDATRTVRGNFRLYSNHTRIAERFLDLGFQALPLILWRKTTNAPNKFMGSGMLPSGAYVTLEHEYILVFRKGGKRDFTAPEEKLRRRESAFFWEERNRWFVDLWDLAGRRQRLGENEARKRSAAFPFDLAYRLVNMYSLKGDTVLDPFLGTGTTLVAALAAGRNGEGFELEPALAEEAERTLLGCRGRVNEEIASRLDRHRDFVAETEGKGRRFRYFNEAHKMKVMTSQETDLRLDRLASVEKTGPGLVRGEYLGFQDNQN